MSAKKCPIVGQLENCVCHLHSLRNYGNKSKLDAVIESSNRKLANGCELDELLERHNALVEAVAWERECRYVRNVMRMWHLWPAQDEAQRSYIAARQAVEELL